MGSSQRLAAVAAVHHARHYYNQTQPTVTQSNYTPYAVNIFFVSATLCGVLVVFCAACRRWKPTPDKPDDVTECQGVYTVSSDSRLTQTQLETPGPPPAYETVVEASSDPKDCHTLQDVVTEPCTRCTKPPDTELPSYEAAVLLKDTKL